MRPVLSIVTVTWNCIATLERTLRSVQAIKTDEMEYIIVDGASTDGTLEVARAYGDMVDILLSEPDSGIYNAMNKGVSLARGDYVLFINGDDELIAGAFPTVMEALREKKADVVCATTVVGCENSPDEVLVAKPWQLYFFNSIPHPSAFSARNLLLKYPFCEELRIASDYDFFLRVFLGGHRYHVLPVLTALHHRGGASGDSRISRDEVDLVRRECLGWRYSLIDIVSAVYRQGKRWLSGKLA